MKFDILSSVLSKSLLHSPFFADFSIDFFKFFRDSNSKTKNGSLNLIFSKIFFLSFKVFSPTNFPLKNTTSKTKIKGFAFPVFFKTEGIPLLSFC